MDQKRIQEQKCAGDYGGLDKGVKKTQKGGENPLGWFPQARGGGGRGWQHEERKKPALKKPTKEGGNSDKKEKEWTAHEGTMELPPGNPHGKVKRKMRRNQQTNWYGRLVATVAQKKVEKSQIGGEGQHGWGGWCRRVIKLKERGIAGILWAKPGGGAQMMGERVFLGKIRTGKKRKKNLWV